MVSMRSLWLDMKGVLRAARHVINAGLEPLNLSSAEGDILFHLLTGSDHLRQEQLAERLDIGKAAISRAVDSLEEKGYVKRERQAEDRRAWRVSLTDKAVQAGAAIVEVYESFYRRVKAGVAEEDLARIASVLSRVAANLQTWGDRACGLSS